LLVAFLLAAVGVSSAGATTTSVGTETAYRTALTTLSGDGSGPHTIEITADFSITGGTDPTYTGAQPLTINGNGHTLDGTNTRRIVFVNVATPLTVNGLTLINGTSGTSHGGGIASLGPVTVTGSTFTHNNTNAGWHGGAIAAASVVVTGSTFTDNRAGVGGAIRSSPSATVTDSTFSGNEATSGSGGAIASGLLTVTRSTFSGNTAFTSGGAIASFGLNMTNSTVVGNTASGGEGTPGGGGLEACGTTTLVYSTVVANTSPGAANIGLDNCGAGSEPGRGSVTTFGSVVALPQGGAPNCPGTIGPSAGSNFSDDASCGFVAATDKQSAGDPVLGPLAANGGPTQTRLPLSGSPLIDAIANAACQTAPLAAGITTDQRGLARPSPIGGKCDIGAVEVPGAVVIPPRFAG
jgi:predicted outer membrane repeat protein